jgi:hypothetical protein
MATGPFIFIATNRLKPGKLEAEGQRGAPTASILEMLKRSAGPTVAFSVNPYHLGGFTRLT